MVTRLIGEQIFSLAERLGRDDRGQGMAEYGLILALVAVLCVAAFTSLKDAILSTLNGVVAAM